MRQMQCVTLAALLAFSSGSFAAETSGTYMSFIRAMNESALPDGTQIRIVHYYHVGTSENAASPFAGKSSECIGRMVVSGSGKMLAGSGFCVAQDDAGNGGWWSWKMDEAGTAACPTVCGSFSWVEGYGSTRNSSATGKWRQTGTSRNGSVGTYTVTYAP